MLASPAPFPARHESSRHARRFLTRLGLVLLVSLVTLELGLRAFDYEPLPDVIGPRYLFERDEGLGIRLRPGFRGVHVTHEFEVEVSINSLGVRDREFKAEERTDLRILSLGDSFAYGFGVEGEETYAHRLEEILAADRSVRVVNAGAPSYGTRQELEILRRLAPGVEPDVVLVAFFFGNDLQDNTLPPLTERGGLVLSEYFGTAIDSSPLHRFAVEHSDLLTFAILRWKQIREGLLLPPPPTELPADRQLLIETPAAPHLCLKESSPAIEQGWAATAEILTEMKQAVADIGARLVLIEIPLPYLLDDDLWRRMCERHHLDPEEYDRTTVTRRLTGIAEQLELPLLDLEDAFRVAPDLGALYFPVNKHLTPQGHQVAARAIADFLDQQGIGSRDTPSAISRPVEAGALVSERGPFAR